MVVSKTAAFAALLCFVGTTNASYAKNLNYRSPSENHPDMGISIHKVNKRNTVASAYSPEQLNFTHGIASGDPYPNSVILWTRVAPSADNDRSNRTNEGTVPFYYHGPTSEQLKVSTAPICVNWRVTKDAQLAQVASSGQAFTSSDVDFTLKVEATGLSPFTQYWYQFSVCGSDTVKSPVGKTKTTPAPSDKTAKISVAVFSCSNFPFGFFNAYGNPVRKNSVDYVIHLGDYIYEYANEKYGNGTSVGRIPLPNKEIYSLYDYRKRHATYRTDLDLLSSTQNTPWIPTWDDHETADNQYRDGSSGMNNTEASFVIGGGISVDQRKMNAVRAYFEWMPIRQVDMDDNLRIWRTFQFGSLFDLLMLDTRNYDRSITDLYWNNDYIEAIANDAGRSLMGGRQENWFYRNLIESKQRGATWRVIGSQIVFSTLNFTKASNGTFDTNLDAWDGYQANKNRTFKVLYDNKIDNNIFLSGDSHASWVTDVVWTGNKHYNPVTGEGAIGAEFGGSAVSSPSPAGAKINIATAGGYSKIMVQENPELHWQDVYYRGYYELHISQQQLEARYFGMPTVTTRNPLEISLANFTVKAGENRLQRPIAGGKAAAGALKNGEVSFRNITQNTSNNTWFISSGYDRMVVS